MSTGSKGVVSEEARNESLIGATDAIATFIAEASIEQMPPAAVATAKNAFLDTLAVAVAASQQPVAKMVREYLASLGGNPVATVIGGQPSSSELAALANGTMAHAEDFDDYAAIMRTHPSGVLVPALLALGEKHQRSGRALLEAYLVGYEVGVRIGRAATPQIVDRGWHATSAIGTVMCAAATANLLGLDAVRAKMALGIAASEACGLKHNFGTMTKPLHAGLAARNGITASELAAMGFSAGPRVLEGLFGFLDTLVGPGNYDLSAVDDLSHTYYIVETGLGVKLYPSCAATHAAIDAARRLRSHSLLEPDAIAEVDAAVNSMASETLIYSNPQTGLEGKFSLEYCVAVALQDGNITRESFTDARARDPRLRTLLAKVRRQVDPQLPRSPDYPATVTVRTTEGRQLSEHVAKARGREGVPISEEELIAKARSACGSVLPPRNVEHLIELSLGLEELSNVSVFREVLSRDSRTA